MIKGEPNIAKKVFDEIYSRFPNFLFFTTIKTGVRNFHCTSCGKDFIAGIHTIRRTDDRYWRIADSCRHNEIIECPVCHKKVRVINTKQQARLNESSIKITEAVAVFNAKNKNDVWVSCYFINRIYSPDGKQCFDDTFKTNVYHLTPDGADFYKRHFGYFGWSDELFHENLFREPFKWDYNLYHKKYT